MALPLLKIAPISDVTSELLSLMQEDRLLHVFNQQCTYTYHDGVQCENMLILRESKHYKLDGYELTCEKHGGHISVRRGSFFSSRRLPMSQMLYILRLLEVKTSITSIVKFFAQVKLNRETVASMLHQMQERMWLVLLEKYIPVFDPSDEVEIDEMWMDWEVWDNNIGPKSREAQWEGGQWIIGLVNRDRTKLWIECMPNRKRVTIERIVNPLLKSWLLRKPRIHTDALKSYEYLSAQNTHYVINKVQDGFGIQQRTFWGNTINVNVNKIENTWRQLRQHLSMRYAYNKPKFVQLHIAEFMYNWYKLNWLDLIRFP